MLNNSQEQPLIYCFPWIPLRAGRREKTHYKEHLVSIGEQIREPKDAKDWFTWIGSLDHFPIAYVLKTEHKSLCKLLFKDMIAISLILK